MAKPSILTDRDLEKAIAESKIPVLAHFWSSWCPACKMTEPIMEELAVELGDKTKVVKVNVDQDSVSAFKHNITGVPTFILFYKGRELARRVGAQSKRQIFDILASY